MCAAFGTCWSDSSSWSRVPKVAGRRSAVWPCTHEGEEPRRLESGGLESAPESLFRLQMASAAAKARVLAEADKKLVDQLHSRVQQQQAELENRTNTVNALQRNFEKVADAAQKQKIENDKEKKQIAQDLGRAHAKIDILQQKLRVTEDRARSEATRADVSSSRLAELERRMDSAVRSQDERLQKQLEELNLRAQRAEADQERADNRVRAVEMELSERARDAADDIQQVRSELQGEIHKLKAKLTLAQDEAKIASDRAANLEEELETSRYNAQQTIQKAESDAVDARQEAVRTLALLEAANVHAESKARGHALEAQKDRLDLDARVREILNLKTALDELREASDLAVTKERALTTAALADAERLKAEIDVARASSQSNAHDLVKMEEIFSGEKKLLSIELARVQDALRKAETDAASKESARAEAEAKLTVAATERQGLLRDLSLAKDAAAKALAAEQASMNLLKREREVVQANKYEVDARCNSIIAREKRFEDALAEANRAGEAMEACLTCMACLNLVKEAVTCIPCGHVCCAACLVNGSCPECEQAPLSHSEAARQRKSDVSEKLPRGSIPNETLTNLASKFAHQKQALGALVLM